MANTETPAGRWAGGVSLVDVAREVGAHYSTVSRALDPATQDRVKESTRQRIIDVANRLGYRPDMVAMGAAMTGIPVIAKIMFSDFLAVCFDILANEMAKTHYMTAGQVSIPVVVRTANGAGSRFGAQHSQSVENWAMMIPGLKVVAPSNPGDVVGLMAAAVRFRSGRGWG